MSRKFLPAWLLALLLATNSAAFAEAPSLEPQRVFVCAHSFMIFTARMLPEIASAAGMPYGAAGQQMLGGSQTLQHWNLPESRNQAKAALREGKVDVLMLSPHMLMPDVGIDNFTKLGLEKNPKLRVLIQSSWPTNDLQLSRGFRNEDRDRVTADQLRLMRAAHRSLWLNTLEEQVRKLNASVGHPTASIVPASDAQFALRERIALGTAPGLQRQSQLFTDALGHPQPPLAVLVSYCHFATIYRRSPVGLPVAPELRGWPQAEALTKMLQEIAWESVTTYPMSGVSGTAVVDRTR